LWYTLQSIKSQTFKSAQWVVADGDSDDGSIDCLRQYGEGNLVLIREKDNGIYDAWNKAVRHSIGEWIVFLGAGDQFGDEKTLEKVYKILSEPGNEMVRIAYGGVFCHRGILMEN